MSIATATIATPTQVKYTTQITNLPAQRDGNNNLMMDIHLDLGKHEATFACISVEHVGSHKSRKVCFTASDKCTVHFTNPRVFGTDSMALSKGKQQWRIVYDGLTNESTECYVTGDKALSATEEMVISPMAPPQIVVP